MPIPRRLSRLLVLLLGLATSAGNASEPAGDDHRAWQHGIDLVKIGAKLLAVWGSAGHPPRPNIGGDWPHDVYYAWIDGETFAAKILVSRPEAQEPPSAALNSRGTLLMTSEDGNGGINQQAGLWDSSLRVLRRYPFLIRRGGHSGHVAALGDRFLVVYGEGWVDGGGWRNLGTGADLHARIVGNSGKPGREVLIARGQRDSWPLVAGSDRNWLMVWQRYPGMTLQSALIGATGAVVRRHPIIDGLPPRYTYDVAYAPALAAYVVAGTSRDRGFAALVSLSGDILHLQRDLPPMASEARIVTGMDGAVPIAVYPANPRGVAVLRLSAGAIALHKVIDHPHAWDYMGTAGAFVAPGRLLFATLTKEGMKVVPIGLEN